MIWSLNNLGKRSKRREGRWPPLRLILRVLLGLNRMAWLWRNWVMMVNFCWCLRSQQCMIVWRSVFNRDMCSLFLRPRYFIIGSRASSDLQYFSISSDLKHDITNYSRWVWIFRSLKQLDVKAWQQSDRCLGWNKRMIFEQCIMRKGCDPCKTMIILFIPTF